MKNRRRLWWGAVFLVVGGLVHTAGYGGAMLLSAPTTTPLGAAVLGSYFVAGICSGVGLILTGASIRGRGRTALRLAGLSALAVVVVEATETVIGAPFGPAPVLLAGFLLTSTTAVAAVLLLLNTGLTRAARWAVSLPAACFLLLIAGAFAPWEPESAVILPGVGIGAAGVLLLRSAGPPDRLAPASTGG